MAFKRLVQFIIFFPYALTQNSMYFPQEYKYQEIDKDLAQCVSAVFKKYFKERTLVLLENDNMQINNLLSKDYDNVIVTLNANSSVSSFVNESKKFPEWRYSKDSVGYIISLETLSAFENIMTSISNLQIWNARSKVVVILSILNYNPKDIREIFEVSCANDILNIIVIAYGKDYYTKELRTILIYTYFPFGENGKCTVEEIVVDVWEDNNFKYGVNLFPLKVENAHGYTLSAAILYEEPQNMVELSPDGSFSFRGRNAKLIEVLLEEINFSLELKIISLLIELGMKLANGTYIGILGDIISGLHECYLTSTALLLPEAQENFDLIFSRSFKTAIWVVPVPDIYPQWMNIYFPFHPYSWFSILLSYIIVTVSTFWIQKLASRNNSSLLLSFLENLSIMLGISARTPEPVFKLRAMFLIWVLCSFVLNNCYQAALLGYMAKPKKYPPINTMKDMVDSGISIGGRKGHKWIFNNHTDTVLKSIHDNWVPVNSYKDGYEKLVQTRNYALFSKKLETEYLMYDKSYIDFDGNPVMRIVPETIFSLPAFYFIRRGSPFFDGFNQVVKVCDSCGLFQKWDTDVIYSAMSSAAKSQNSETNKVLGFSAFMGAFSLLGLGILLSIISFTYEIVVEKYIKSKANKEK